MPQRRLAVLLAATLCGLPLLACASSGEASSTRGKPTPTSTANRTQPNWVTQTDPSGFVVSYPKGWSATAEKKSGRVDVTDGSSKVSILPFFTQQQLTDAQATLVFKQLAASVAPEITWQQPTVAGNGVLRSAGSAPGRRDVGLLIRVGVSSGTAGNLYIAGASQQDYNRVSDTLAQIIQSFHVQGQPASQTPAQTFQYVRWTDPTEGAFSAEAPKGWKVEGGTVRPVADLVQGNLNVTSPDGAILLYIGSNFQVYRVPDPATTAAGFPPGSTILAPDGYRFLIEPFPTASQHLTNVILPGRKLSQLTITAQKDRPDWVAGFPTYGGNSRYAAAQVDYKFVRNGQPYRGSAVCFLEQDGGVIWYVKSLNLFETPVSRYSEGVAANVHLNQTFVIDPQWARRQAQTSAAQAGIWRESGQAINNIIVESYGQQQTTQDEISMRRERATLGVTDVTDPVTGKEYRVDNSPNYYWIDQRGYIVGTTTDTMPTIDFRPLVINP
jgi:hypothetical protein